MCAPRAAVRGLRGVEGHGSEAVLFFVGGSTAPVSRPGGVEIISQSQGQVAGVVEFSY